MHRMLTHHLGLSITLGGSVSKEASLIGAAHFLSSDANLASTAGVMASASRHGLNRASGAGEVVAASRDRTGCRPAGREGVMACFAGRVAAIGGSDQQSFERAKGAAVAERSVPAFDSTQRLMAVSDRAPYRPLGG